MNDRTHKQEFLSFVFVLARIGKSNVSVILKYAIPHY